MLWRILLNTDASLLKLASDSFGPRQVFLGFLTRTVLIFVGALFQREFPRWSCCFSLQLSEIVVWVVNQAAQQTVVRGPEIKVWISKACKLIACLANSTYRRALSSHRVAAGVEHEDVLRSLGDCRTVVDVGANRGQFALVARRRFPKAKIIAFESLSAPASTFQKVFAGDEWVRLHQVAISPERGEATIHLSSRDDSSSLLPITAMQNAMFPGTAEVGTTTITVGTLVEYVQPEVIKPLALLKLDVQGYELEALKGCEDLIDRFAYIYVECSFVELYAGQALAEEVIVWLRERNFALRAMHNVVCQRDGKAIQADFLFAL